MKAEGMRLNGISPLKVGFVDLAAMFFAIGGVVSLIMSILMIPIASIYPLVIPANFSLAFLVTLIMGLVCSLGAVHCYSLTTRRILSKAGMRGIIFGALLLIFSIGLFDNFRGSAASTLLTTLSAVLILIAGAICFVLRHFIISPSLVMHQQTIAQRA